MSINKRFLYTFLYVGLLATTFLAPHVLHAQDSPVALFDASYTDTEWSIRMIDGHFKYFFNGYAELGNPPLTSGHTWTPPHDVLTARIQVGSDTTCNQFRWGGTYGIVLWTENFTNNFETNPWHTSDIGGGICEFRFYTPIPAGTALGAAFLSLTEDSSVMGSSKNPGVSLNGSYADPIPGGFALQLCGAEGCTGGFTPSPVATTTEEAATTTPEVSPTDPDVGETATSTPPTGDPQETIDTTPVTPIEPEITQTPERTHGGRNPSKVSFYAPTTIEPLPQTPVVQPIVTETTTHSSTAGHTLPTPTAAPASSIASDTAVVLASTTTTAQIAAQDPLPNTATSALTASAGAALPVDIPISNLFYIPLLLAVLLLLTLFAHLIHDVIHESRRNRIERPTYQHHTDT